MEKKKISIYDFTNRELINAIVEWIKSEEYLNFANEYADALSNDSWLEYYNEKLNKESLQILGV